MKKKAEVSKWSLPLLEDMRKRKDPIADQYVAALAATKTEKELYGIMQFLLNEYVWIGHDELDETSLKYINDVADLPDWVDNDLLKKGEDFFAFHGFEISMVLMMKALPATYCCWRGAEVVHATGRMTAHSGNLKPFTRRLMQTSKFVLNVLNQDGMVNHGGGLQATVKVRTLHAFIRYYLAKKDWDVEKYGEPINQEDYAGTMLSFSVFVIEGLERIGIRVTEEEKNAYYHVWRVVGHVIGVEDALLPENYDEAAVLGHAILDHQKGGSESGKELTQACLNFLESMIPFKVLKFLPENMICFLLGEELSAMAGVKKSKNPIVLVSFFLFRMLLRFTEFLKRNIGFIGRFAIKNNPRILDYIIRKFLEESSSPFTPQILQQEVKTIKEKKD